ncbi:MAG: hypothetical protein AB1483_02910 [Candidatus Zixiibacteriota bacterium]
MTQHFDHGTTSSAVQMDDFVDSAKRPTYTESDEQSTSDKTEQPLNSKRIRISDARASYTDTVRFKLNMTEEKRLAAMSALNKRLQKAEG